MKRLHTVALTLVLVASPSFAMKVTNLDTVAHTVEVTGNGDPDRRTIQPDDTEYFTGQTSGMITLVQEQPAKKGKPKKKDSVVNADGMLSRFIGNGRDSMPADADNNYVIWPGGELNVQSRTKHGGSMF